MKTKLVVISALSALVSPVLAQSLAPPGESFGEVTKPMTIIWHKTNSPGYACMSLFHDAIFEVRQAMMTSQGCFRIIDNVCHVVAKDPPFNPEKAGSQYGETDKWWALGHEVKHCFDGYFHK